MTGDYLFDPQAGQVWSREEDHLALIIELLGDFPKFMYNSGKSALNYFDKKGKLKRIKSLKPWGIHEVFLEKYRFSDKDCTEITEFLLPILQVKKIIFNLCLNLVYSRYKTTIFISFFNRSN